MNPLETRGRVSRVILWALLAFAIVLYGFPFAYLLLTSFKTPLDAIAVPPSVMPEVWTLENYVSALSRQGVPAALVNGVLTGLISTNCPRGSCMPLGAGTGTPASPSGVARYCGA